MLLVFGVPLFLFGCLSWRSAVIGALGLAILEGALRKWLLPQYNQEIFFAKDFLLLGGYARFFGSRLARMEYLSLRHRANAPLVVLFCIGVLQLGNPLLPSLPIGLLGLQGYLLYAPLLYIVPSLVQDRVHLTRLAIAFVAVASIALVIAPIQYFSSPDSVWNVYSNRSELGGSLVALAGGSPRVTGTFSYISGFTALLTVLALGAAAHLALAPTVIQRILLVGLLAILFTEAFMSGARVVVLILAVGLPASRALAALTPGSRSRAPSPLVFLGFAAVAAILGANLIPSAWDSFGQRATAADDLFERLAWPFTAGLAEMTSSGPTGYGIGSTYQGAGVLIPTGFVGPIPPPAENEWQRIVLELGPLGLVVVILVRLAITAELWAALRTANDPRVQPFIIGALLFSIALLPGNLVFDHTASLFYWFLAGIGLAPRRAQQTSLSTVPVLASNVGQGRQLVG